MFDFWKKLCRKLRFKPRLILLFCLGQLACLAAVAQDTISVKGAQDAKSILKPKVAPTTLSPLTMPAMIGPLTINPQPFHFTQGIIHDVYVSGAASLLFLGQTHPTLGDRHTRLDVSNAQVFIQKPEGRFQFFFQLGAYSIPTLGLPYVRAAQSVTAFGVMPQAYLKYQPSKSISIQAGKLPTLVGVEYAFSYENLNIERGLLWNQENTVNRGLQFNYTSGKLSFSAAFSDGYYSGKYNWFTASLALAFNSRNTLVAVSGGNLGTTAPAKTPGAAYQNNGSTYDLIYTWISGRFTFEPYVQYTRVPASAALGISHAGSTLGETFFISYTSPASKRGLIFSCPIRLSYIASPNAAETGVPNLLYGPNSQAYSATLTPGYQLGRLYLRTELSFIRARHLTPPNGFGSLGTSPSQSRALLECGILF